MGVHLFWRAMNVSFRLFSRITGQKIFQTRHNWFKVRSFRMRMLKISSWRWRAHEGRLRIREMLHQSLQEPPAHFGLPSIKTRTQRPTIHFYSKWHTITRMIVVTLTQRPEFRDTIGRRKPRWQLFAIHNWRKWPTKERSRSNSIISSTTTSSVNVLQSAEYHITASNCRLPLPQPVLNENKTLSIIWTKRQARWRRVFVFRSIRFACSGKAAARRQTQAE